MALPTLRPYYVSRGSKLRAEQQMVARQEHETDMKQRWSKHSQYFHDSNVQSSKQEAWTSLKSFQDSMKAYNTRLRAEDKKRQLVERRARLRALLDSERKQYEQELKEYVPDRISVMKERTTHLKSEREQERKKLAEERLREQWRLNCPELREMESQQMQQSAQEEWGNQIQRKQQEMELMNKEKERYELELAEESLAALRLEEEVRQRTKIAEEQHALVLKRQIAEIRQREEEAALLEQQQALLDQERIHLEKAEAERRKLEEAHKRTELGRVLLHQHKARMRRKSQQIQDELELDMKILSELVEKERIDQNVHKAKQERAKADVEWMKKVIADQLRMEKEREAELDILYQEEVARMWHRREAEWERERLARERLMAEVMAERQQQIDRGIDVLKARQAESIKEREELLRDMESLSQLTARESTKKEEERVRRADELREQISERKLQSKQAQLHHEEDVELQRCADEAYHTMVQEEKERMTSRGLEPKIHEKKKYAWY